MAFDPFQDPLEQFRNPFGLGTPYGQQPQQRPGQPLSPLPPEEADSMLSKITGKTLGGLSWVGETLGKPGRAVRGLLAGKPGELANLIPFSDTLGITDPEKSVTGRNLLENMGVVDKGVKGSGLDLGDVAGFGADILTDPLTYITGPGAALTKAGQAAKKAGTLGTTVGERLALGHGGHFGLGLPFMEPAATFDLRPQIAAAKTAAGAVGRAASYIPGVEPVANMASNAWEATAPARRSIGAMFNTSRRGQMDKIGYEVAPAHHAAEQAALSEVRGRGVGVARSMGDSYDEILKQNPMLIHALEGAVSPIPGSQLELATHKARSMLDQAYLDKYNAGLNPVYRENYAPKVAIPRPGEPNVMEYVPKSGGQFGTRTAADLQREDVFDFPQLYLNQMARDPRFVGPAKMGTRKVKETLLDEYPFLFEPKPLPPDVHGPVAPQFEKARDLASRLRKMDPSRLNTGFWSEDTVSNLVNNASEAANKATNARLAAEIIEKAAVPKGAAGADAISARRALAEKGIVGNEATNLWSRMKKQDIDPETAKALFKSTPKFETPELLKPVVDWTDKLTSMFKAGVTAPFPGFHVRNKTTGLVQNLASGAGMGSEVGAAQLLSGKTIPGIAQRIGFSGTDEEATRHIADLAYQYGLSGAGQAGVRDITGGSAGTESILKQIPGLVPTRSPLDIAKSYVPHSLAEANPLHPETFAPVVAGREAGHAVEQSNRLSGFISLLEKGWEPEAAAKQSLGAHFDYGDLTSFERNVMRRVIPFYTFASKNVPYQAKQLLEHPGGIQATAIKAADAARDKSTFTPDYLGQGMAAPLGPEENGIQRFLTGLDLPHEQALSLFDPRGPARSAEALLSQLNPLLKAPLEYATGQNFFTGQPNHRDLAQTVVKNSPLARLSTTAEHFLDPSRDPLSSAANLLTGATIRDVNVDQAKQAAARERLNQMLDVPGVRQFMTNYARPEDLAGLPPEVLKELQLQKTMDIAAQKRAREQKRIGVVR